MKLRPFIKGFFAVACLAGFAAWSSLLIDLIQNQGDRSIGFHPAIMAIIPGCCLGAISAIILLVLRQWQIGFSLILGSLLLLLVVWNGQWIEDHAWENTINAHAKENENALGSIRKELNNEHIVLLGNDEMLSPMEDFRWYGINHFSAPNGVYMGFISEGVPHARIQKIRHGYRGIALVASDAAFASLSKRSDIKYSRVGSSHWYIWYTGP